MQDMESGESISHPVAIFGARGYSGLELARILLRHPAVKLTNCYATEAEWNLYDLLPVEEAKSVSCVGSTHQDWNSFETAFLALPAEASQKLAFELVAAGKRVIDLSGGFRLSPEEYTKWYGHSVASQSEMPSFYGLVPWSEPPQDAKIIANPGCFATSVLMALIPLLRANLVNPESLVIDSKSGTTGAGKKAAENLLFSEVDGECLPYRVGRHQHLPEMIRYAEKFSGVKIDPHFCTHLLPVRRGIISSIYATLSTSGETREKSLEKITEAYAKAYQDYSLVDFGVAKDSLLSLKQVVGTARTRIAFEVSGDKLFVFSLIDNLLKGAASQAVENMNRLLDLPVSLGLNN
jgi:N-acetyl-gamma-glutamyl-phosphate reductase